VNTYYSGFVWFNAIISLGKKKHLHKIKISKNGSIAIENGVGTGVVGRSLILQTLLKVSETKYMSTSKRNPTALFSKVREVFCLMQTLLYCLIFCGMHLKG
jgi:hypothetical protein